MYSINSILTLTRYVQKLIRHQMNWNLLYNKIVPDYSLY